MKYVDTIKDEKLKKAVKRAYKFHGYKAYFLPSSLTGKHHPPDERGIGGLNKHVEKVCWFLDGVVKEFLYTDETRDILLTAAYFHDLGKIKNTTVEQCVSFPEKGKPKRSIMVSRNIHGLDMHPYLSAKLAQEFLAFEGVKGETIQIISDIIETHMSHWYGGKRPTTELQKMFALADYIVAQEEFELRKENLWQRIRKKIN